MDGLNLLIRAVDAGLIVRVDGDRLVVTGPVRLAAMARDLLVHKDAVIAACPVGSGVRYATWPEDGRDHYRERLAIADDLGMDTGTGLAAERVARREAMRVAAGVPVSAWPSSRGPGVIDAVLEAFPGAGGLRFMRFLDEPEEVWS